MKKQLLFSLFSIAFFIVVQSPIYAQLTATVTPISNSSPKIADWVGMFRTNEVMVNVVNPRIFAFEGFLQLNIYNEAGSLIAESVDDRQEILNFPQGSTTFNLSDVIPNDPALGAMRLLDRSLNENLINGFVPEGVYQLCINILDLTTRESLLASGEICRFINIQSFQPVVLTFPADGMELQPNARPILRWNGLSPTPSPAAMLNVIYRVVAFELQDGQSAEIAFRANFPYLDEFSMGGMPQLIWPASYELPAPGVTYVWNVQALDETTMEPIGENEGWGVPFTFKTPEEEEEEEEEIFESKNTYLFAGKVKNLKREDKNIAGATLKIEVTEIPVEIDSASTDSAGGVTSTATDDTSAPKPSKPEEPEEPEILEWEVVTDEDGKFRTEVKKGYTIEVLLSSSGYEESEPEEIVMEDNVNDYTFFATPLKGQIEGSLTLEEKRENEPLRGIIIEAVYEDAGEEKVETSVSTDESGNYEMEVYGGDDYTLNVKLKRYAEYSSEPVGVVGDSTSKQDIDLAKLRGTLQGKASEKGNGNAIANGRVVVISQKGLNEYLESGADEVNTFIYGETTTGSDGSFRIENLPINDPDLSTESHVALLIAGGYAEVWGGFSIRSADEAATVNLQTEKVVRVLSGIVKDEEGNPLASTKVELFQADGTSIESVSTDGNGQYFIGDLPDAELGDLIFSKNGFERLTETNRLSELQSKYEVDVTLPIISESSTLTVRGKVINQFGEPYAGVKVVCEEKEATTDDNGKFEITETSYEEEKELTLSKDEESKTVSFTVQNNPEWELEEVLTEYKKQFKISFFSETGEPVQGVDLVINAPNNQEAFSQKLNSASWEGIVKASASWVGSKISVTWQHPDFQTEVKEVNVPDKDWFESKDELAYTLLKKTVTIKGKITDQVTRNALPNATIKVDGTNFSAQSDNNGNFEIKNLTFTSNYKLKVSADTYKEKTLRVNNNLGDNAEPPLVIDNQDVALENLDLNAPETVFGFKARISNTTPLGEGKFKVEGTLTVPSGSPAIPTSGQIEFKDLQMDIEGKVLDESVALGSELPVKVFGLEGKIASPVLQMMSSSGQKTDPNSTTGTGTITGNLTLNGQNIEGTDDASISELTLKSDGLPVGIWSSGSLEEIEIENELAEFDLQGKTFQYQGEGKLSAAGLAFAAGFELLQTEVTAGLLLAATSDGAWKIAEISSEDEVGVESSKGYYNLKGKVTYEEGQFYLAESQLEILGQDVGLAGEDAKLEITESGQIADTQFKTDINSTLDGLNIEVGIGNVEVTSDAESEEVSINLAMDASSELELLSEELGFEMSLEGDEGISAALAAPIEIGLASPGGKSAIEGVSVEIAEIGFAYGTEEDFFSIAGGLGIELGSAKAASEVAVTYDAEGFHLEEAALSLELSKGIFIAGSVMIPEEGPYEGGLTGLFELAMAAGGNDFKLTSTFGYKSKDEWEVFFKYAADKGIPLGQAELIGLGGGLAREKNKWAVRVETDLKHVLIPKEQFFATVGGQFVFSSDGKELLLSVDGTPYAFGTELGYMNMIVDFKRGFFEGNIETGIDQGDLISTQAALNIFVGAGQPDFGHTKETVVQIEGMADLQVMGQQVGNAFFAMGNNIHATEWYQNKVAVDQFNGVISLEYIDFFGFAPYLHDAYDMFTSAELDRIPDEGIVYEFSSNSNVNENYKLGSAELSAAFSHSIEGFFAFDLNWNADLDFQTNFNAGASFKIGDYSIADVKTAASIQTEAKVTNAEIQRLYGAGSFALEGWMGTKCSDCNDLCLFGARGCLQAQGEIRYVNNHLVVNVNQE